MFHGVLAASLKGRCGTYTTHDVAFADYTCNMMLLSSAAQKSEEYSKYLAEAVAAVGRHAGVVDGVESVIHVTVSKRAGANKKGKSSGGAAAAAARYVQSHALCLDKFLIVWKRALSVVHCVRTGHAVTPYAQVLTLS